MILTDREIQIALSNGQIKIEPAPNVEAYSSTSVDLRLDPILTLFRDDLANDAVETAIDPSHPNFVAEKTLAKITSQKNIDKSDGFLLTPRKLVLGWTIERIELPPHSRLAACVEGKSSLAALGSVSISRPQLFTQASIILFV
ncbi:MAG TPA: dCTP deaminase [Xanthobacteraceae bacterium]|nr:dCTP deaminase [Xanthobacteraceae bacterium]